LVQIICTRIEQEIHAWYFVPRMKRMQTTQMHQNDTRNYLHIFDFMSLAINGIHGQHIEVKTHHLYWFVTSFLMLWMPFIHGIWNMKSHCLTCWSWYSHKLTFVIHNHGINTHVHHVIWHHQTFHHFLHTQIR
jgi:hypothetical protein